MTLEMDPSGNSLLVKDHQEIEYDNYQISMLLNNEINGLLPCRVRMIDDELIYSFDTKGYSTLELLFQDKRITKEQMEKIIRKIDEVYKSVSGFLLDPGAILLYPQTIFSNREMDNILFVYLPGRKASFEDCFENLAEFILQNMDYKDSDGVVLGYNIYRIAKEEQATFRNLLLLVDANDTFSEMPGRQNNSPQLEKKIENRPVIGPAMECNLNGRTENGRKNGSSRNHQERQTIGTDCRKNRKESKQGEKKRGGSGKRRLLIILLAVGFLIGGLVISGRVMNLPGGTGEGKVTVETGRIPATGLSHQMGQTAAVVFVLIASGGLLLVRIRKKGRSEKNISDKKDKGRPKDSFDEGIAPTTYIAGTEPEIIHKLVRPDSGDELILNRNCYRIGKSKELNDLCLVEDTISREHCMMKKEQGEWYMEDLGSTNGTYINGTAITKGEQMLLSSGDDIILANVEFLFL